MSFLKILWICEYGVSNLREYDWDRIETFFEEDRLEERNCQQAFTKKMFGVKRFFHLCCLQTLLFHYD